MICQRCKKNEASYKLMIPVNGKYVQTWLCETCHWELSGELEFKQNNDLWTALFGDGETRAKTCPVCGTRYTDYERTGLLGCASCYDVFKEELLPSIRRIQGKVRHVGKQGVNNDEHGLHRKLKTLQEELEAAMREKRYAEAGNLNRLINDVIKQLYGGQDDE